MYNGVLVLLTVLLIVVLLAFVKYYKDLSERDQFTGCYNKDWAVGRRNSKLVKAMKWAKLSGSTFGVLFIDMDNFKEVNDNRGHVVGDDIIRRTVATIKSKLSKDDIIVRFGGDEFLVIFEPFTKGEDKELLYDRAECIRDSVEVNTSYTVSLGGTFFQKCDDVNVEVLLSKADKNLYRAKELGRNQSIITGQV